MAGSKNESLVFLVYFLCFSAAAAEAPYRFYDWEVTYGNINPLGVPQQAILINGQFPGPKIECQTNDNLIINVHNNLSEPFLLSWYDLDLHTSELICSFKALNIKRLVGETYLICSILSTFIFSVYTLYMDYSVRNGLCAFLPICRNGLQERKNSWQDGVSGTNCPIPPSQNFTYRMQAKDQIGSFFYFPSLAFHKAAGGFGAIYIHSRPLIPVPFSPPADEYTVLIGDWYTANHKALQNMLDSERKLPSPDGILINGKRNPDGADFTVEQGKMYRLHISNVGLHNTLNFLIQGHNMTLVEVEGTHTVQNSYTSLDVHIGQSLSVLFIANRPARDYRIVVSTCFTNTTLRSTTIIRYAGSSGSAFESLPSVPRDVDFSINQARSISGPRSNPQGSYHYGSINVTRTIRLANSARLVGGKQRYAVNGVSFVEADTPLKLADYYNISGVFKLNGIPDSPPANHTPEKVRSETAVMDSDHHSFIEVVLENSEDSIQSWHLDGYNVYPRGWTAVLIALDNVGMWNMRSEVWARRYLGQQFYLRVYTPSHSFRDELPIPDNALLCGRAATATNNDNNSRLSFSRC
ncbi:L-ascorbate oxidase-like protein [Dichanthelium oligosanthes]|uniref:L-ascorbate oxidase-like protein n=1 Tax=Dichanthelium oligosanthes TaxID=888268 RepID=A0A1E5W0U7_9POAL|nr:L-ascorbate oxidase-like protein [Dichanthelium oligosanthes]